MLLVFCWFLLMNKLYTSGSTWHLIPSREFIQISSLSFHDIVLDLVSLVFPLVFGSCFSSLLPVMDIVQTFLGLRIFFEWVSIQALLSLFDFLKFFKYISHFGFDQINSILMGWTDVLFLKLFLPFSDIFVI